MLEPITTGILGVTAARVTGTVLSGLSKKLTSSVANLTTAAATYCATVSNALNTGDVIRQSVACHRVKEASSPR